MDGRTDKNNFPPKPSTSKIKKREDNKGKRDKRTSLSLIGYADDFVILHEDSLAVVQKMVGHYL
jgi:hypothetical protein